MGRSKAFLPWGKTTLIEHLLERLRPVTDELIVVVKDARAFRYLKARVVEDLMPDAHAPLEKRFLTGHALGGLYTGLRLASHDLCFACACDAPFLNPGMIRFLIAQAEGCDAVIPQTREGLLQPLHAVYARSALPAIEEQLQQRRWDLRALAETARVKIVGPEIIARYDPAGLSSFNLNTPSDYATACAIRHRLTRVIDPSQPTWYTLPFISRDAGPNHLLAPPNGGAQSASERQRVAARPEAGGGTE